MTEFGTMKKLRLLFFTCLLGTLLIPAHGQEPYSAWKTANAIPANAAADSDADQDGIPLLMEYALGLSPALASDSLYLNPQIDAASASFGITYPRLRNDIAYQVEGSPDLQTWSIAGIDAPLVAVGDQAIARIPCVGALRFLRLRVALVDDDNISVPGTATAPYPTLENISLEWSVAGDNNRNGVVRPRFRKAGDASWREGLPLKWVPSGSNEGFSWAERYAGSLFDLEPDTVYEVELILDDPDGGSATQTLQVRTRPIPQLPANPAVINATPATLSSILSNLSPGDFVELGSGNYNGFEISRNGTAAQPIVLRGTPNALITGEVSLFSRANVHLTALTVNGRIRFNGSDNITITRCRIQGTVDRGGHGIICFTRGENSYIADNTITGTTVWNESALGNNGDNLGEGIAVTGPGHVIEHNRVRGFRDGISFMEDGSADDQQSIDILDNEISECGDDGIEADFAMGNCRIMRNRITNTFIAMSSQPSLGGPTYFIRNAAYNVTHVPFKLYRGSKGDVLYHNTVVKNGDAFAMYNGSSAIIRHLCTRNNLFIGGPGGTYNGFSSGNGDVIDSDQINIPSSDLNFDAFGSSTGFSGQLGPDSFASLAQLRSNTSETDAQQSSLADFASPIALPTNPLTAFAAQDLRPSASNNLVGNAEPLPNINQGAGATIGAYEPGQALPAYGPR